MMTVAGKRYLEEDPQSQSSFGEFNTAWSTVDEEDSQSSFSSPRLTTPTKVAGPVLQSHWSAVS